ncbi:MAG: putative transport system ATP-binding protein [Acidimicrobiaceae bacterium]|nr:putative transport system ATP-binding protein [Acidimicrobiaceae bacterium]
MPERAASCRDTTRVYRSASGPVHALRGVDVDVVAGQVTAIVGPSGSGKSTLLRILAGLDRPTEGTVHVAGTALAGLSRRGRRALRRRHIGFVFARPADNLVPYLTAAEHLRLAAELRGVDVGDEPARLLRALGLDHRAGHRPVELSGGEQQRLALAAAVIGRPALVLADEPTAELDRASAAALVAGLHDLAGLGVALAVATHDPVVVESADRVVLIHDGEVVS